MKVMNLRIELEQGPSGMHYARSPDMPELNAASRTAAGLQVAIKAILEAHFDAVTGSPFSASRESGDDQNQVWIVAPRLLAEATR